MFGYMYNVLNIGLYICCYRNICIFFIHVNTNVYLYMLIHTDTYAPDLENLYADI